MNVTTAETSCSRSTSPSIPDVAKGLTQLDLPLDQVGMSSVFVPVQVDTSNTIMNIGADARISINLVKKEARGIHMSRLYLICQKLLPKTTLSRELVCQILQDFLHSQSNLCDRAHLDLSFQLPLLRKALISDISGWKRYPISIRSALMQGKSPSILITLRIDYASTCPCSAALSKSHIQQCFYEEHKHLDQVSIQDVSTWLEERGLLATPHGQRSSAFITLNFSDTPFAFEDWINDIESTLATATLTAVKRQDEQRFAVLSAQNLMFAEDAARKLGNLLLSWKNLQDFDVEVFHYESLHSHDAYARISKSKIQHSLHK